MKPVHYIVGGACVVALLFSGCIVLALLLPAIQAAREASRRMACSNHFKQIGLGIHNYHSAYKQFPLGSGGTGGTNELSGNQYRLSGLVPLLPFIEEQGLWNQISTPYPPSNPVFPAMGPAPWIDVAQYPPFGATIEKFHCPSNPGEKSFGTNFAFCYGDSVQYIGLSDLQIAAKLAESQEETDADLSMQSVRMARVSQRGMFANGHVLKFRDVIDGLSNTIAMTELARSGDRGRANAMVAKDVAGLVDAPGTCVSFTLDPANPSRYKSTISVWDESRGFRWADGNIRFTGVTTVLPPNSASCTSQNSELEGVYSAASYHHGGCHVLMGDGAVIFVTDSIDAGDPNASSVHLDAGNAGLRSPYGLWGALGTKASMEAIEEGIAQ